MYNRFPHFPLPPGIIQEDYASLAHRIAGCGVVAIDGYQGVRFDLVRKHLSECFAGMNIGVDWFDMVDAMKPVPEIEALLSPFLGGDDPLFGKRCTLELTDLFDRRKIELFKPDPGTKLVVFIGPGAALAAPDSFLVYIDLPKDVIQHRARAGTITNLGCNAPFTPKEMYKRFYFADWVLLNKHKDQCCERIGVVVDGQSEEKISWMEGDELHKALYRMSRNLFRVRPWFEPGVWGGKWMMDNIPGLSQEVPNYAWSFEMIVPENGLVLESQGCCLEISFDWLMYCEAPAVLGTCYKRFGKEFPIRFDFLDTFGGGNLSIQCHPQEEYIRQHFGENFTQQEAYYILDTKDNAVVNLGFRNDIDARTFRQVLETSQMEHIAVDIPQYIGQFDASKHDFFLIPEGTVHGSGANNLVLEISTTPYIFTFKMYDWLRLNLDGKPRDLNIGRAFENLDFTGKGEVIVRDYISRPVLLAEGEGWQKYQLPTHERHYYDVVRYHIMGSVAIETENRCHVLNLVEGDTILVETEFGHSMTFSYAETFAVPAAAGRYRVSNLSPAPAILVLAFIR